MFNFNEVVIQLVNSISKPGQSCSLYRFLIARFARSRVLLQVRYLTARPPRAFDPGCASRLGSFPCSQEPREQLKRARGDTETPLGMTITNRLVHGLFSRGQPHRHRGQARGWDRALQMETSAPSSTGLPLGGDSWRKPATAATLSETTGSRHSLGRTRVCTCFGEGKSPSCERKQA